jgi:hypothetical protein
MALELAALPLLLLLRASAPQPPPPLHEQFRATVRASSGFGSPEGVPAWPNPPGFNGDGCLPARKLTPPAGCEQPVTNTIWYDGVTKRIAQTNPGLKINATLEKNTTEVVRFDVSPPADLLLEPFFNEVICYSQPLHTTCMNNGSDTCPATWAGAGQPWNGVGTYNKTSLLSETAGEEVW